MVEEENDKFLEIFEFVLPSHQKWRGKGMRLEFTGSISETASETAQAKPRGSISIYMPRLVTVSVNIRDSESIKR